MRVLLVDDHAMFRQGLVFLLEDLDARLQFLEAGTCEQALEQLATERVNLVLLDMHMPGKKHLQALEAILEAAPQSNVVVLSGEDRPDLIRSAIEAGASGFIPKSSSSDILVAALQLILAGGVYLPSNVLDGSTDSSRAATADISQKSAVELLSGRQLDVLLRAIQAQPNKIIALELGIAEGTVKAHLSAAYRALGVHNRTEAVFAAARLGLKTSLDSDD
jgi:DNA-binding NarL/FixJ family response regulator